MIFLGSLPEPPGGVIRCLEKVTLDVIALDSHPTES